MTALRIDRIDCHEAASGARMHAACYRAVSVYRDLADRMPKLKSLGKNSRFAQITSESVEFICPNPHPGRILRHFEYQY